MYDASVLMWNPNGIGMWSMIDSIPFSVPPLKKNYSPITRTFSIPYITIPLNVKPHTGLAKGDSHAILFMGKLRLHTWQLIVEVAGIVGVSRLCEIPQLKMITYTFTNLHLFMKRVTGKIFKRRLPISLDPRHGQVDTVIYRHSTLFWICVTTITNCNFFLHTMFAIHIDKQRHTFVWFDFDLV